MRSLWLCRVGGSTRKWGEGDKVELKIREAPCSHLIHFMFVLGLVMIVKRAHWHSVGDTKIIWHELTISILKVGPHRWMKWLPLFHVDAIQRLNNIWQYSWQRSPSSARWGWGWLQRSWEPFFSELETRKKLLPQLSVYGIDFSSSVKALVVLQIY